MQSDFYSDPNSLALVLMMMSAVVPFFYFKWRRWL